MTLTVCLLASEAAPLSKTGGLADVSSALTKYLHAADPALQRLAYGVCAAVSQRCLRLGPIVRRHPLGAHHSQHWLSGSVPFGIDRGPGSRSQELPAPPG